MASSADPLLVAAIAAGGVVLGAAVGAISQVVTSRVTGRGEERRLQQAHQHERQVEADRLRREVYVGFLGELDEFFWVAHDVYYGRAEPHVLDEKLRELDRTQHRLQLIGAEGIGPLARETLYQASNEVRPHARQGDPDWGPAIDGLRRFQRQVEAAARADVQRGLV